MGKLQTATSLLVVRGRYLHKECPEKGNSSSTPACCNCRLAEGEKPHPANYGGCRHAKEELQKKSQRPPKTTMGRVFSSARTTPGVSFAAALRGSGDQQQQQIQTSQVPVPPPPTTAKQDIQAPALQQTTGQSVQTPLVNSQPLDNMLRVVTVVQQIMTEVSSAVKRKNMAITKIFLKLMNQNGH
jgi:hypothetical protein